MKAYILLFIAGLSITHESFCQQTIKINDLNMPSSPALVLLGKSPATIEKPANPRALAVSLVNIWQENGAIEFAPYWFKDRPSYTFEDNMRNVSPVFQTFGVSIATTKADTIRNIAVGFRTQMVRFYASPIKAQIIRIKNRIVDLLSVEDPADIDLDAIQKAKDSLNFIQSKVSINVELAGAYMGQSSPSKDLASTKAGAWLNIRWTPYHFPLDLVFLARYTWSTGVTSFYGKDSTFFDYGINFSYQEKMKNFDVQAEYVNRRDISGNNSYDHFAFVANYQIIPGIVVVASVGKDFKKVNNLFALLGIKLGISKEMAKLHK